MREENIPFIFKYLLRWVPGLKIDEGGVTPSPSVPGFVEGEPLYTFFYNTERNIEVDLAGLDWSKATNVYFKDLDYTTCDPNPHPEYFTYPTLDIMSSEIRMGGPDSMYMHNLVMKVPTGCPALDSGEILAKDGYMLYMASTRGESEYNLMDSPLFISTAYTDLPGFENFTNEYNWAVETEYGSGSQIIVKGTYADAMVNMFLGMILQCEVMNQAYPESNYGMSVNTLEQQDKWKVFLGKKAFVNEQLIAEEDKEINILFYNASVTPDFNQLVWDFDSPWVEGTFEDSMCMMTLVYAPCYEGSTDYNLAVIRINPGVHPFEDLKEPGYLIYGITHSGMGAIYADSNGVAFMNESTDYPVTKVGWFPQRELQSSEYVFFSENMQAFAPVANDPINLGDPSAYVDPQECWKNWIGKIPF